MGDAAISPLAEAMNRLWAKHLPQMEERVATLQNAARSLASGTLSEDEQQRASSEAHKLAGVLGTFGLKEGTELAREAEGMYLNALGSNPVEASRLFLIAEELKRLVSRQAQATSIPAKPRR